MAARSRSTSVGAPGVPRSRKVQVSGTGRHVIDLTQLPSPEIRMADYEKAFGLPSALRCSRSICESPRPWKKIIASEEFGNPALR